MEVPQGRPVMRPLRGRMCARGAARGATPGGCFYAKNPLFLIFFAHILETIRATTLKFGMEVPQGSSRAVKVMIL